MPSLKDERKLSTDRYTWTHDIRTDSPEGQPVSYVCRALDTYERRCVLRILENPSDPEDADYKYARKSLDREYDILELLHKRNLHIAPVPLERPFYHKLTESTGRWYLAMEDLGRRDLGEHVQELREGHTESRAAEQLLTELFRALKKLHAAGILHRDLKQAHVLYGSDDLPRFVDFNSATQKGKPGAITGLEAKPLRRSDSYSSPLQLIDPPSEATEQDDVFSLAAACYFALTGNDPPQLTDDELEQWRAGGRKNHPSDLESSSSGRMIRAFYGVLQFLQHVPSVFARNQREEIRQRYLFQLQRVLFKSKIERPIREVLLRAMDLDKDRRFLSASEVLAAIESPPLLTRITSQIEPPLIKPLSNLPTVRSAILTASAVGLIWWQATPIGYSSGFGIVIGCIILGVFAAFHSSMLWAKWLVMFPLLASIIVNLTNDAIPLGGCTTLFVGLWTAIFFLGANLSGDENSFATVMVFLLSPFLAQFNLLAAVPLSIGFLAKSFRSAFLATLAGFAMILMGNSLPALGANSWIYLPSLVGTCSAAMVDFPGSLFSLLILPLLKDPWLVFQAIVWGGTAGLLALLVSCPPLHLGKSAMGLIGGLMILALCFYIISFTSQVNPQPAMVIISLLSAGLIVLLLAILPRTVSEWSVEFAD